MKLIKYAAVAALSISLANCNVDSFGDGIGDLAKDIDAIINGNSVTQSELETTGVVAVRVITDEGWGLCTGTVLTNSVVMTAKHCIHDVPDDEPGFNGEYDQWGPAYLANQIFVKKTVDVGDSTALGIMHSVAEIKRYFPSNDSTAIHKSDGAFYADVILLFLDEPLELNGSTTDFWRDQRGPFSSYEGLENKDLECYGYGDNHVNATGSGILRKAYIIVDEVDKDGQRIKYKVDAGGHIQAEGDSGGPCFFEGKVVSVASAGDMDDYDYIWAAAIPRDWVKKHLKFDFTADIELYSFPTVSNFVNTSGTNATGDIRIKVDFENRPIGPGPITFDSDLSAANASGSDTIFPWKLRQISPDWHDAYEDNGTAPEDFSIAGGSVGYMHKDDGAAIEGTEYTVSIVEEAKDGFCRVEKPTGLVTFDGLDTDDDTRHYSEAIVKCVYKPAAISAVIH